MTDIIDMRGVPFQMDASRNAARPDEEYRAAWKSYLAPAGKPERLAGSPLGKLVMDARTAMDMSRNELARRIGVVDGWYVTQIETGEIMMPRTYMRKLSEVLDIPLTDLLTAAFEAMEDRAA